MDEAERADGPRSGVAGPTPAGGPYGPVASEPPYEPPLGAVVGPWRRTGNRDLFLRITGGTLWMGTTGVPLAQVTRVDAFRYTARAGWAGRLLLWLGATGLLCAPLHRVLEGDWRFWEGRYAIAALVLGLVGCVLGELYQRPRPVLAVETAGGSTIAVTLPDHDRLRATAGRILYAVQHPDAEFGIVVQRLGTRTRHYGAAVPARGVRRTEPLRRRSG
ncbi:DUF6232 family protein [Streptomyces sp. NPDC089919]|uniref:DUF6232 family protein n=1 Tax=Streptomyces sp. NPDC089919 TaxID=3155188 RepID=UPI0034368311